MGRGHGTSQGPENRPARVATEPLGQALHAMLTLATMQATLWLVVAGRHVACAESMAHPRQFRQQPAAQLSCVVNAE
jgi:hypothetical protein